MTDERRNELEKERENLIQQLRVLERGVHIGREEGYDFLGSPDSEKKRIQGRIDEIRRELDAPVSF